MSFLAEEVGLVRGHDVDEVNHFFVIVAAAIKKVIAVLPVGIQLETGQTPLEAAFEHDLFLGAERDARLLVDQAAEPVQIAAGKAVGVSGHHLSSRPAKLHVETNRGGER
jgi:hypothetical protein